MWLLIPILLYSIVFLYVRHVHTHWKRKGFPGERSCLTWRFLQQVYKREFRHVAAICEAYRAGHRQPLWGIYCFFRPILIVRDLRLAQMILEQSNGHFNGSKWDYVKGYRRFNLLEKLAPIFGRQYLIDMLPNVAKVGNNMVEHLEDVIAQSVDGTGELDMQELLRIYAINVIGNLVYGQDVNNFECNEHVLTKYATKAFQQNGVQSFTLSRLPKKSSLIYRLRDLLKSCVEKREEAGFIRKDVLQLLVKFRNGNDLDTKKDKVNWFIENGYEEDKLLSVHRLAKVAEDMLKMSLNTIAATTTLTLFEILNDPQILEQIRAELRQLHNEIDDTTPPMALNLEHLDSLKYMDMCIQETLRKYPPIPIIERVCRKTYTLPNSRYTIVEGKTIMVPLLAIHRDEKYFAEPMKYKPTRFLECKTPEHAKESFMGYGFGGTQCMAQNFSKMVIKLALVKLLHNFELKLSADAVAQVEIEHRPAPYISTRDGLKIRLKTPKIKAKFYL